MRNDRALLKPLPVLACLLLTAAGCGDGDPPEAPEQLPAATRLAGLLGAEAEGFERALVPRPFRFPDDHGPHPGFRNEWWYFTGNLADERGRRFGYELTLFRFSLTPEPVDDISEWRSNQVFVGHFAVSDIASEAFHVAERTSRAALGLAGATAVPFRVWLEDWQVAAIDDGSWRLRAASDDVAVDLELRALKPPVANGREGLSVKSADPGNASYYYSVTRLATRGSLRVTGRAFDVTGLSWLDREWSSSALAADQSGWDWFALQLDDGRELMFYQLRRVGGSVDPASAGTLVDADGRGQALAADDVQVEVTGHWTNPAGDRYPSGWRIGIPSRRIELRVEPAFEEQELATVVRYWEGAVTVAGRGADGPLTGRGYVELTGYAD